MLWPLLSLVFDLAILSWGWELRRRYWYFILIGCTLLGLAPIANFGLTAKFDESVAYLDVVVAALFVASLVLLRKNAAVLRPQELTKVALPLAATDVGLLASFVFHGDNAVEWGPIAMARLVAMTIVAWRLSSPHRNGTESEPVSFKRSSTFLPIHGMRVVVWTGLILWTWLACWLYPRCVARNSSLHGDHNHYFFEEKFNMPFEDFSTLGRVWHTSQRVHNALEIRPQSDQIPEYLFAIQEVEFVWVDGHLNDEIRRSLRRFPNLKSVKKGPHSR